MPTPEPGISGEAAGGGAPQPKGRLSAIDALFHLSILLFVARALQGDLFFLYGAVATGMAVFGYFAVSGYGARPRFWLLLGLFAGGYLTSLARNALGDGWLFLPLYIAGAGLAWRIHLRGIGYRFSSILFYSVAADFAFEYFVQGKSPHGIFAHSGNHISVTFISLAVPIYIACTYDRRPRPLLPVVVTFVISVLALGIGGIISSALLLIGVLLYLVAKIPRYRVSALLMSVALALVIVTKMDAITSAIERETAEFYVSGGDLATKLGPGMLLSGNERYRIWADYRAKMNVEKLLLGTPLDVPHAGYTNLHSSYYLLHARTGLWFFPVAAVLITAMLGLIRRDMVYFICLAAILVRAYSDTVYLGIGNYDWVLLYLVLFADTDRRRTRRVPVGRRSSPARPVPGPRDPLVPAMAP